uniref:hypothetical protein n=1 Tax=Granulicella sp. S190 TaxID=1747226 RepID=UPI00131D6C44
DAEEEDMIIQYEKPEQVKQLRAKWLESLGRADQMVKRMASSETMGKQAMGLEVPIYEGLHCLMPSCAWTSLTLISLKLS